MFPLEAKKFMVVMNAATAIVTTKSPYMARVSFTIPQLNQTLGTWAAQHGLKSAYIMVTDYGPGIDAEAAFQKGFKEAGGDIVGSVRMAVQNPDFSAYVQRAKDLNPQGIFIMIPGGAQPGAFGKALAERGIDPQQDRGLGTSWRSPTSMRSPAWATSRSASSRRATTTTITTRS